MLIHDTPCPFHGFAYTERLLTERPKSFCFRTEKLFVVHDKPVGHKWDQLAKLAGAGSLLPVEHRAAKTWVPVQ